MADGKGKAGATVAVSQNVGSACTRCFPYAQWLRALPRAPPLRFAFPGPKVSAHICTGSFMFALHVHCPGSNSLPRRALQAAAQLDNSPVQSVMIARSASLCVSNLSFCALTVPSLTSPLAVPPRPPPPHPSFIRGLQSLLWFASSPTRSGALMKPWIFTEIKVCSATLHATPNSALSGRSAGRGTSRPQSASTRCDASRATASSIGEPTARCGAASGQYWA